MSDEAQRVRVGGQRPLTGASALILRWYSIVVIGYHLYAAQFGAPEVMHFRPTHVAMYVGMIFLVYGVMRGDKRSYIPWYDWVLFVLSWLPTIYIYANYEYIVTRYAYVSTLTPLDWAMGILALVLVGEACRRAIGLTLTILFLIFMLHALFGPYFPGPLQQTAVAPMRLIDHLYLTTSGLYGTITGISATYVLMFVLLGAVLEKARGGDLFMNLAIGLMGRAAGGPGKAAVLASGLFGSISGAATANVYATGTFTIPLMIRTGFQPRFAAAVEAVASASGQLVPPIMGSAAFLIADFTRTPYLNVAQSAALPAALYLFAVYVMVHLETMRHNLPSMDANMVAKARGEILSDLHMLLVLAVVVAMLIDRRTPFFAAYIGVVSTFVLAFLRPHTRLSLSQALDAFELGARRIAPIAAALFVAGLVVGVIELSGFGLRFTALLLSVTDGNLLATMILVMLACIVLGMGLPTAAAYMIVAIFGAPALIKLGVEPLAAHFFVFYYAIISAITPPVAIAAYAAATIAETPLQSTGFTAMKLGAAVYLVPFALVFSPALLLIGDTGTIMLAFGSSLIGIVALAACVQGYLLTPMGWIERTFALLAALTMLHGDWRTDLAGITVLAALIAVQLARRTKNRLVLGTVDDTGQPGNQ